MSHCSFPALSLFALAPLALLALAVAVPSPGAEAPATTLHWEKEILTVRNPRLPGSIEIHYLEAFCRPGSTDRDWKETVIPHRTELLPGSGPGFLRLRNTLADGVFVEHEVTARPDEVDFRLVARNPTGTESQAHWAQPCIRVDRFTGFPRKHSSEEYLPKCFLFLEGKPVRMPTARWAKRARYTPGQVWCPRHVDRNDVNPRPLSDDVPSSGLIGCYSSDDRWIMASAWEPYQELFQGVITCVHSDFRLGGLKPGETRRIRGKLYLVEADMPALVRRYARDFPEHGGG